jgi:uncharacterized Tic20 family protein
VQNPPETAISPREPTSDEKLLAAIAHGSIFIGVGLVAPLLIYILQREKSAWVGFHSLQALFYHLGAAILGIIVGCCATVAFIPVGIVGDSRSGAGIAILLTFVIIGLIGLVFLLYFALSLVALVQILRGRDFSYPVAGALARRFITPSAGISS